VFDVQATDVYLKKKEQEEEEKMMLFRLGANNYTTRWLTTGNINNTVVTRS